MSNTSTLERSLEDVVDDHVKRSELIRNPKGPEWKDQAFQSQLMKKFGRDYTAFAGIVTGLCGLLEELSHKLGLLVECTDYSRVGKTQVPREGKKDEKLI